MESGQVKFIDDLSIIEILNLLSLGLSSYDCMSQVPSDISISNQYLDSSQFNTQSYLKNLEVWTNRKQMKLNVDKTDYMIINFTEDYQFNTRLKLEEKVLQQVHSKKLLGLVISDDLSWKANTTYLVKRAHSR